MTTVEEQKCTCKNNGKAGYCSMCNAMRLPKKCNSPLATRPILYTDIVNGEQTCCDDLWAVTTEELNALETKVREDIISKITAWMRIENNISIIHKDQWEAFIAELSQESEVK